MLPMINYCYRRQLSFALVALMLVGLIAPDSTGLELFERQTNETFSGLLVEGEIRNEVVITPFVLTLKFDVPDIAAEETNRLTSLERRFLISYTESYLVTWYASSLHLSALGTRVVVDMTTYPSSRIVMSSSHSSQRVERFWKFYGTSTFYNVPDGWTKPTPKELEGLTEKAFNSPSSTYVNAVAESMNDRDNLLSYISGVTYNISQSFDQTSTIYGTGPTRQPSQILSTPAVSVNTRPLLQQTTVAGNTSHPKEGTTTTPPIAGSSTMSTDTESSTLSRVQKPAELELTTSPSLPLSTLNPIAGNQNPIKSPEGDGSISTMTPKDSSFYSPGTLWPSPDEENDDSSGSSSSQKPSATRIPLTPFVLSLEFDAPDRVKLPSNTVFSTADEASLTAYTESYLTSWYSKNLDIVYADVELRLSGAMGSSRHRRVTHLPSSLFISLVQRQTTEITRVVQPYSGEVMFRNDAQVDKWNPPTQSGLDDLTRLAFSGDSRALFVKGLKSEMEGSRSLFSYVVYVTYILSASGGGDETKSASYATVGRISFLGISLSCVGGLSFFLLMGVLTRKRFRRKREEKTAKTGVDTLPTFPKSRKSLQVDETFEDERSYNGSPVRHSSGKSETLLGMMTPAGENSLNSEEPTARQTSLSIAESNEFTIGKNMGTRFVHLFRTYIDKMTTRKIRREGSKETQVQERVETEHRNEKEESSLSSCPLHNVAIESNADALDCALEPPSFVFEEIPSISGVTGQIENYDMGREFEESHMLYDNIMNGMRQVKKLPDLVSHEMLSARQTESDPSSCNRLCLMEQPGSTYAEENATLKFLNDLQRRKGEISETNTEKELSVNGSATSSKSSAQTSNTQRITKKCDALISELKQTPVSDVNEAMEYHNRLSQRHMNIYD